MKRRNSPGGDLGAAGEIAGDMEQDIDLISDYEGDSIEFYGAMQKRAVNYVLEIRHHFGDRLFPEGAHAPTTPAEMGKGGVEGPCATSLHPNGPDVQGDRATRPCTRWSGKILRNR